MHNQHRQCLSVIRMPYSKPPHTMFLITYSVTGSNRWLGDEKSYMGRTTSP